MDDISDGISWGLLSFDIVGGSGGLQLGVTSEGGDGVFPLVGWLLSGRLVAGCAASNLIDRIVLREGWPC